jgi:mRNA-degrading endonuclease RelE of RelBE toxin-antitoxin system
MNINVRYTQTFERQLKKYQKKFLSIETDLESFISDLEKLHKINFEREFYKYRLAVKSKSTGKSGGFRIVTFEIVVSENLKNAIFSSHLEVEFPMTNQFHPINYINHNQSQIITSNTFHSQINFLLLSLPKINYYGIFSIQGYETPFSIDVFDICGYCQFPGFHGFIACNCHSAFWARFNVEHPYTR